MKARQRTRMSQCGRLSICQRRETSERLSTTNNKQRKYHKMDELDGKSIDTQFDSVFRCLSVIMSNEVQVGTSQRYRNN